MHPLASLHWRECPAKWPGGYIFSQAVLLHNRIYVIAHDTEQVRPGTYRYKSKGDGNRKIFKLYSTTADFTLWLSVRLALPNIDGCALATYHSQLVLVGGNSRRDQPGAVNKLWVSKTGTSWQSSLPPMPTKRYDSVAVSIGNPEYLVVAGGISTYGPVSAVEVLGDKVWSSLQSLPRPTHSLMSTFHNGNLYMMAGLDTGKDYCAVYCTLESLQSACEQACSRRSKPAGSLWKTLNVPDTISSNGEMSYPVSFQGQLIATDRHLFMQSSQISAYSPFTSQWVRVGDLPEKFTTILLVFPTNPNELVAIGHKKVSKASIESKSICCSYNNHTEMADVQVTQARIRTGAHVSPLLGIIGYCIVSVLVLLLTIPCKLCIYLYRQHYSTYAKTVFRTLVIYPPFKFLATGACNNNGSNSHSIGIHCKNTSVTCTPNLLYTHTKWRKGVCIEQIWCAGHTCVFTVYGQSYNAWQVGWHLLHSTCVHVVSSYCSCT